MTSELPSDDRGSKPAGRRRAGFYEDFRRFFVRGLSALLPTLITLWLFVWVWNFLWTYVGQYLVWGITRVYDTSGVLLPSPKPGYLAWAWQPQLFVTRLAGVLMALVLIYLLGVVVGHFIGQTAWRLGEVLVMRVPLVRAIYPAVKQVTDFLLSDRKAQFAGSRVVAVRPHEDGIWSIAVVTGAGIEPLSESVGEPMVTVFVPSSPTAFSGYVMIVPRDRVVELPLTVEEAFRMLISGGVVGPGQPVLRPQPGVA